MTLPDLLGSLGALLIVAAYLLLERRRLTSEMPAYFVANGLGAGLILFSLLHAPNIPAMLIEGFWVLISLGGLWRTLRARRTGRPGQG